MQKVQKTYTEAFKREAVLLAQTSGKPIAQVARELGISYTRVHQWRKELAEHGLKRFQGVGTRWPWKKKIAALNEIWRERDRNAICYKKTVSIFSHGQL